MGRCIHCDEVLVVPVFSKSDHQHLRPFCCLGCLTVADILQTKGLTEFYDIKQRMGVIRKRSPVELKTNRFEYLDDPEFVRKYTTENEFGGRTLEFYLEGIHCLACLWLIEKLPEYCPGAASAKLDLERSVVAVKLEGQGKFCNAARELSLLGYTPHPLKHDQSLRKLQLHEERNMLMRIGVAGAAAGNIMLYAVSLYGGAQGEYARLFNWLTVAFGVPALTYSAWPFYVTAWNAIRNRILSIDIPISLALLVGLVMGVVNGLMGVDENYFDSLSTLVFLLLLSRYFLRKLQQNGLSAKDLYFFHRQEGVERRLDNGTIESIPLERLKVGDTVVVPPDTMLAVDGEVIEGRSHLNISLLTGESLPVLASTGHKVFAGTQNLEGTLYIRTEAGARETRLGKILQNVENGWAMKAPIVTLTAKVSQYFTLAVFVLSFLVLLLKWPNLGGQKALELAITLLIVTCPCALALATPLTFIKSLSLGGQHGLIIKNDEVMEKLSRAHNVVLDKTGTVTYGRVKVKELKQIQAISHNLHDVIWSLESRSHHPVGRALREHVFPMAPQTLVVIDLVERAGEGVAGNIDGIHYQIGKDSIRAGGKVVGRFSCEDIPREDSQRAIDQMRSLGVAPLLVSGDKKSSVNTIAQRVGLATSEWIAEATPESKAEIVQRRPHTIMVGDGANDAVALSSAGVGIAVAGAMDISLRAADVYLTSPGLEPVAKLIVLSRETMKVIRRNLVLSLIYNATSVVAVFTGHITPLLAAIIMPVSSLTIFLSTMWGTKKMRQLWK